MAQPTLDVRPATKAEPHKKRLDIQGLRAVAVLAVLINHTFGFLNGGFVGVDVFFVISGFVITSLLLREHDKNDGISFLRFYKRRVRRIMPASILVLAVTVAAGYLVYLSGRANTVLTDGLWALLFAGNWRFAMNGTDYWAQDTPVSPLQHYWSLGVEEQFYFVWPTVIAAVLFIAADRYRLGRVFLVTALTVLSASSLVWALHETATNPTVAYFSTFSRAWELGVGALLAVGAGLLSRMPAWLRPVLVWVGLAGIAASFVLINKESLFPAPWAILPVLATALVIAGGTSVEAHGPILLTNRPMTYIGDISYSLYLWHFPTVILLEALMPDKGFAYYLAALVLMFGLAILSYHFVEKAILDSPWLSDAPKSRKKKRGAGLSPSVKYAGLGVLVVATALVVALALTRQTPVDVSAFTPVALGKQTSTPAPAPTTAAGKLTAQLNAALTASEWPELRPALDNILEEGKPDEDSEGCGNTDLSVPNCSWDSGKAKTVVVLGDSTGITLLPTVRAAMGDTYNVRGMTKAACVALDLEVKDDRPDVVADCRKFKADAIAAINQLKPDLVLITNTSGALGALSTGTPEAQAGPEWRQGTIDEIQALKPSGANVVVVSSPPMGIPPAKCGTRASTPKDCQYRLPQSFTIAATATAEAASATGAKFMDTRGWFCHQSGVCPAFVGKTPVKRDAVHTTKQYATALAPVFKDALASLKVT